jgi:SAM-dependent methyltransferase
MTAVHMRHSAGSTLSRYFGRGHGEGLNKGRSQNDECRVHSSFCLHHAAFTKGPHPDPLPEYRAREKFEGLLQILRFNWPSYVIGGVVVIATLVVLPHLHLPSIVRAMVFVGLAVATFWMLASIIVSHWVYDRSGLMRWRWIIDEALDGADPRTWVNIHCGLDESTPALRAMFPHADGRVMDIYDDRETTEPSIRRARKFARNAFAAEPVAYANLPIESAGTDAVFLLLAAHELRTEPARAAFFREIDRILAPGGRIIVAEHLRDLPNAITFGHGALHFHSRRTWLRAVEAGGFEVHREFRITPFVRVFVLRRPS